MSAHSHCKYSPSELLVFIGHVNSGAEKIGFSIHTAYAKQKTVHMDLSSCSPTALGGYNKQKAADYSLWEWNIPGV